MLKWSYNPTFPNTLSCIVKSLDDYFKAIELLQFPIDCSFYFYGESVTYELLPFDGDEKSWREYFFNTTLDTFSHKSLKLKPNQEEFPIVLVFSCNHKYLYWISLDALN